MSVSISLKNLRASDEPDAACLKVGGVTPFSATDYPGKLAAVVFIQGCPWRCGYCHNAHLQARPQRGAVPWTDVLAFLRRRRGLIDAVVFSGGEPAMDPALPAAIADVRALGFGIGLHSAGIYPQRLAQLLPQIDWIGLDIKAPFESYEKVTQVAGSGAAALACLRAVLASGISHEVRTTVHADLLSEAEVLALGETLAGMGVRRFALQAFRKHGCVTAELNAAGAAGRIAPAVAARMQALFPHFVLRQE